MEFERIRTAFSMADIALKGNTISVTYSYQPLQYFQQSFGEDNMDFLSDLLSVSNALCIHPIKNDKTRVVFYLPERFDFEPTVLPHIETRQSSQEIITQMHANSVKQGITDEDRDANVRLITEFVHDWRDEKEFFQQMHELFDYLNEAHKKERQIIFQSHANYPDFKNAGVQLMKYCSNIDLFAPDGEMPGVAELTYSANKQIWIEQDFMRSVRDIAVLSTACDFGGDLNFMELTTTFYI